MLKKVCCDCDTKFYCEGNCMIFSSSTYPSGEKIRMLPETLSCTCPDCVSKKKEHIIFNQQPDICKRRLCAWRHHERRRGVKGSTYTKKTLLYSLTLSGKQRTEKNEFYGQSNPQYRGYTEKVFHILYNAPDGLSVWEICDALDHSIPIRSVSGLLSWNKTRGFITAIEVV